MADYKVVFRSDGTTNGEHRLLWSPKSPALLTAVQVSRNTQTATAFLQVKIRNVSDETIRSVGCSATLFYSDGTNEVVEFDDLDVDLEQTAEKPLKAQKLSRGDVEAADVILTNVTTDEQKWKAEQDPIDVPKLDPLRFSERAMRRRHQLLSRSGGNKRAWNRPVFDSEGWWVCSCGQLNVGRTACCECGLNKSLLLSTEDETELLASADERDDAIYQKAAILSEHTGDEKAMSQAIELFRQIPGWKDADKRLMACNEAVSANKTRLKRYIAIGAVVVVATALLAVFVIAPAITRETKYGYVQGHLNRNDETTYNYLRELKGSGYKDSAELYSKLFDWRFEIGYSSSHSYRSIKKGNEWPDEQTIRDDDRDNSTDHERYPVYLYVRATSGPPRSTKRLKISKQIYGSDGSTWGWVNTNLGPGGARDLSCYDIKSDGTVLSGELYKCTPGTQNLWSDEGCGCKVKVTDYDSGEVIYEGEAIKR